MRMGFKGTQGRALNMHTWTYIPLGKLISLSLLFHQKDGEGSPSGGQGVWGPRNELRPPCLQHLLTQIILPLSGPLPAIQAIPGGSDVLSPTSH